jgi:hypothetical protein
MDQHDGGPAGGPGHRDDGTQPRPDADGAGLLPLRTGGERDAPPAGPYVGDPDDVWLMD